MNTPLHHHPNDGAFREDCARCNLERAAPELLEALQGIQITLIWTQLRNLTKAKIVAACAREHHRVTALLDRVAPVQDGERRPGERGDPSLRAALAAPGMGPASRPGGQPTRQSTHEPDQPIKLCQSTLEIPAG